VIEGTVPHPCWPEAFRIATAQQTYVPIENLYEGVECSKRIPDFIAALLGLKLGKNPEDLSAEFKQGFTPNELMERVEASQSTDPDSNIRLRPRHRDEGV
jgi:hypothetical protein